MGTQFDYTCPNCSKECFVDESLVGQNITCPSCSKEFFATAPDPNQSPPPHLKVLDKIPFLKGHRRKLLEEKMDELLRAGPIDDNAKNTLLTFAASINLEPADVSELQQERFQAECVTIRQRIKDSKWLTDEDIAEHENLQRKYGVHNTLIDLSNIIYRCIYLVESKHKLPDPVDTQLMLDPKEAAYFCTNTTWCQTRTHSYGYSGGSVSVPTGISGVRFRVGSYTPMREEEMTPLSDGDIYVTSKRLLFEGEKRNTSIPLKKVVNIQIYTNALQIDKSTGKPDVFMMPEAEACYFFALINRLK